MAELLKHRIMLSFIGIALLLVIVLLPFTIGNAITDTLGDPDGTIYRLPTGAETVSPAPTRTRLQVSLVGLDELHRIVTLRVSGHHLCDTPCTWNDQVVFYSLANNEVSTEGLPPSGTISLPAKAIAVSQTFDLPLIGQPIRYPFDQFRLRLGIVLQREHPDGTIEVLSPAEAQGHLFLTFQEQLPRHSMYQPTRLDVASVSEPDTPFQYLYVQEFVLERPLYLRAESVLLVLMISTIAAYAVIFRPFEQLLTNAGALVLGIWGIRAILTPASQTFLTALDFALGIAMLLMLATVAVRAVHYSRVHSREASLKLKADRAAPPPPPPAPTGSAGG